MNPLSGRVPEAISESPEMGFAAASLEGKPRDTKIAILPSTTRKGTTLSTSAALDSPSVIDKLVSPPHASRAGTSAESENSHNIDNVSAVLDDSGSLGSFLDATIAKSRQIENTETPNATTPVNSPESVDYSSDDPDEDYVELDDDFIEKCNATTDARKIKKLLAEHAVRYKPSPDPKFATSPINIRDKDYDFSLDLSHIAIVEKTPFCGTEKESAVEHMTELSTLSGVFSDDVKMRTYFVAKIFPFSLKDDAKTWYNNLPPGSIKSPTDLRDVFFRKYFPASAQHAALQRIYNFDQEDGEKLPEAWARFCSLIRAQPDHDLEKHDLLDIFYSGLTIESRAYLDSCAGCVFRKRTPDDAEELLAKIGRNHDDWSTPEPTPTPIVKKRGMIKLNDEDMREAKKSLKEKGIKPEDVKNLPPIEDICETIPPSSMIEERVDIAGEDDVRQMIKLAGEDDVKEMVKLGAEDDVKEIVNVGEDDVKELVNLGEDVVALDQPRSLGEIPEIHLPRLHWVNKAPGAELPHLGAENSELRQKRPGESHAQAQHIRSQDLSSFDVRFQREVVEEDKLPASPPFKRMKELKTEDHSPCLSCRRMKLDLASMREENRELGIKIFRYRQAVSFLEVDEITACARRSCDEAIHLGERIKAQLVSLMEVAERVIFNAREARERLLVAEDLA
ncbi:hypothetical protein QYE76_040061 [Lolium multiflorum]|uniref:Retrotransposon gag domain-containing protein n=1 Tax=Lolium multiflorum TaxID=4521 RepID=A0AAD8TC48_LOLMU|nr:hypothetical protein QYE76_040061 [Lolium multiflorum]